MIRIGHGYDVHRFDDASDACEIQLGGVPVPAPHALLAHSDGDVVLHALCDALLGAVSAGDIGEHFPDNDDQFLGADSRVLLQDVYRTVRDCGYELINADMTVVAQTPRLKDHKAVMRDCISGLLGTAPTNISVKATTTENLGFIGRKEGIAVHAVCLLQRSSAE